MTTWKDPHVWTPGDDITSERENRVTDDLWYLREQLEALAPPGVAGPRALYDFIGILWIREHWLPSGFTENEVGGTGWFDWFSERLDMGSGLDPNGWARLWKAIERTTTARATWDKPRRLSILFKPVAFSNSIQWLIAGGDLTYNTFLSDVRHFGFLVVNDLLCLTNANGALQKLVPLAQLTESDFGIKLEAVLENNKVKYYIDDVLRATVTDYVPAGSANADIAFFASAWSTEAGGSQLRLLSVRTIQEGTVDNPWGP